MKLKLYNTESRIKEEVVPLDGKTIKMYTCGPTVYNFAHIGNFRTYVFEDLLRRCLKFFGYPVFQVMNLTDVDDKTIKGAIQNHITLDEFTKPYIEAFFEDLKTLNIEPAEAYPAATDYIQQMIVIIERLLKEGVAYHAPDGSVYFDIDKFPSYGRLSHLHLDELESGASQRVCSDEYDKEHVSDFVLWKIYDPDRDGDIFWDSPFGKGRPGWHIECSAMAMQLLGESIDIHCGGVDNLFPHHENEIAQCEAFSHKRFVSYWLHAEHLLVDHKKMSKSLGNFFTLRDLLSKGYSGKEVRYMLMHAHYRTQLNFTFPGLDGAVSSLQRLADFIARLRAIQTTLDSGQVAPILSKTEHAFRSSLADDLNISPALAAIFDLVREVNTLCDTQQVGKKEAEAVLALLQRCDTVLGVLPLESAELEIPQELQDALAKRERARVEKNWKVADECRAFITAQGYLIEDTPAGARLKKGRP
jgi:cysteinyl-tRNA synthetase